MINHLQAPTFKVYLFNPHATFKIPKMYIKDQEFNVCFRPAIIGRVSPQGVPPYSNFPIRYTFWCSPQHKQGILHSGLIKNPIMPYKKNWRSHLWELNKIAHVIIEDSMVWHILKCKSFWMSLSLMANNFQNINNQKYHRRKYTC